MNISDIAKSRQYSNAAARIAAQSLVTPGEVALDLDTSLIFVRITSGWLPISVSNTELIILASAARTTTTESAEFVNQNARGIVLFFNITVVPGVDTVTMYILAKDPVSGVYPNAILSAAARAAAGMTSAGLYPGIGGGFTTVSNSILPRVFKVQVAHSGPGSFTYSVGGVLMP